MHNKENIIAKLKSLSPIIYDVVMTYDMGYEFSAISKEGVIYPSPGMLLYTSSSGHMPKWYSGEIRNKDHNKAEIFFSELDVIPYEELSFSDLNNILSEVESLNDEDED